MRFLAILLVFLFGSCIYEAPLTEAPTRKIDERLIGDWVSVEEKPSAIQIRKFDDSNFILIDGVLFTASSIRISNVSIS